VTLRLAAVVVGLGALALLIVRQLRQELRFPQQATRVEGLVLVLCLVVLLFALAYDLLAQEAGQFEGLRTRTDALYFTVTILATVGFGDVHATGQAARAIVTLQMVFDLVFVATAAALLGGRLRRRASARQAASEGAAGADGADPDGGEAPR
jgi:voltage-gated potassium channel